MVRLQKEEVERQTIYRNPLVANFLMDMLKNGKEIEPKSDTAQGYRYLNVEESIGKNTFEAKDLLKKLASAQILSEKLSDMMIYCPSCNSADISTNYVCPFCSSPRVIRNALIEHIACGYIDNMAVFRADGDLFCPKCKARVGKDDYRSAGKWYECGYCKKKIENPIIGHTCRGCHQKFTLDDAKYIEVYTYALSDTAKAEIKGGALFSSLAKSYFENANDNSSVPKTLKGESGVEHQFDILFRSKKGKNIAIDYLFSMAPINQAEIMAEYGKAFDAKVELFIMASQITEDAAKIAKNLGIKVILGDLQEALKQINNELKSMGIFTEGKEVSIPLNRSPAQKKSRFGRVFKKE